MVSEILSVIEVKGWVMPKHANGDIQVSVIECDLS